MAPIFAYLRITDDDPDRRSMVQNALSDIAIGRDLPIERFYVDTNDSGTSNRRPALTSMLTAIQLEVGRGKQPTVLTLAPCHLSWDASTRRQLESQIVEEGAELVAFWKNHEVGATLYP